MHASTCARHHEHALGMRMTLLSNTNMHAQMHTLHRTTSRATRPHACGGFTCLRHKTGTRAFEELLHAVRGWMFPHLPSLATARLLLSAKILRLSQSPNRDSPLFEHVPSPVAHRHAADILWSPMHDHLRLRFRVWENPKCEPHR